MPCPNPQVASLGYREPSLVFLVGTGLALPPDGAAARSFLEGGGCRLLFVEARERDDFNAAWPVASRRAGAAGRGRGLQSQHRPARVRHRLRGGPVSDVPHLSVVVPVKNEAGNIAPLVAEIEAACAPLAPSS